jgi:hypothetical protein
MSAGEALRMEKASTLSITDWFLCNNCGVADASLTLLAWKNRLLWFLDSVMKGERGGRPGYIRRSMKGKGRFGHGGSVRWRSPEYSWTRAEESQSRQERNGPASSLVTHAVAWKLLLAVSRGARFRALFCAALFGRAVPGPSQNVAAGGGSGGWYVDQLRLGSYISSVKTDYTWLFDKSIVSSRLTI